MTSTSSRSLLSIITLAALMQPLPVWAQEKAKTPPADRVVISAQPTLAVPAKPAPNEPIISKTANKSVFTVTHITTTGSMIPNTVIYYKGSTYNVGPRDLPTRLVTYNGYVYAIMPINVSGHAPEVVKLGLDRP